MGRGHLAEPRGRWAGWGCQGGSLPSEPHLKEFRRTGMFVLPAPSLTPAQGGWSGRCSGHPQRSQAPIPAAPGKPTCSSQGAPSRRCPRGSEPSEGTHGGRSRELTGLAAEKALDVASERGVQRAGSRAHLHPLSQHPTPRACVSRRLTGWKRGWGEANGRYREKEGNWCARDQ